MRAGGAILAALTCLAAVAAGEAGSSEPSPRVTTAERLRVEFAPKANASTARPTVPAYPTPDNTAVVRLPRFDVRERPIPLRDHEVLTPKGRLAVAKATTLSPAYRYTFGPLSWAAMLYFNPLALLAGAKPNDAEALVLHEQNEAIRRDREIRTLEDLGALAERAVAEEQRATETSFRPGRRETRGGAD